MSDNEISELYGMSDQEVSEWNEYNNCNKKNMGKIETLMKRFKEINEELKPFGAETTGFRIGDLTKKEFDKICVEYSLKPDLPTQESPRFHAFLYLGYLMVHITTVDFKTETKYSEK